MAGIIFSLNANKASGPNSLPYRILFLLKINFQSNWKIHWTSFMTGVFPFVFKAAKVDYSDYGLISILLHI